MERAKADDDDGNRAFGDGGGEEEEALLKKEITKLTKKAQTLTVINTALQQENDNTDDYGESKRGYTHREEEEAVEEIELEEDLEKLRAENLKLLVGGEDGKEYLNEEEEERVKALKSRMHQLQASLQTNELKLAEEMNERERLERVRQRQDGEIENLKVSARERQEELRRARQFSEQLRVEFQRKEHAMKKRFEEELSKNPTSSEGGGDQNSEMDILRRELKQEKERGKDLETRIKELEESMNAMESRHGKEQDQLRRETRMAESRARQCEEELTTAEAMRAESIAPLIKQMEIVNEEKTRESERRDEEEHRLKESRAEAERKRKEMEDEVAKTRRSLLEEKKKYEMLFNSLKLKVDEVDALDTKRREALEVVKETQTLMHEMREREGDLRNQCASMEKQLQRARIQESELREREKVIKAQLVDTRNELEASVKFGGGGVQSYNSMEGMRREREEEEEEYVAEDGFEFGTESDTNQTANVVIQALKHKLKEASNRLIRADIKRKESEKSASEMHYKTIDIERELEKQKKEHATLVELLGEKIERLEFLENSK
ncbi:unknown protein [Bathycoccus prasinos]|uniref:Uncharacterized protein n=1 Tax=Bathycoccus prasinos TaxID=41875 RepID=K8EX86_9CHLO|nr:unknown protein [Bathycoccus prasinos]CCO17080.1 unknown protein [Bathycoccus prasinos]|eukprot:XP_007512480.1 unknown protein [Bathycoccus prasinos]